MTDPVVGGTEAEPDHEQHREHQPQGPGSRHLQGGQQCGDHDHHERRELVADHQGCEGDQSHRESHPAPRRRLENGVQGDHEHRHEHEVQEHSECLRGEVVLSAPLDELEQPERQQARRDVADDPAQDDPGGREPQELDDEREPERQRHRVGETRGRAEIAEHREEARPREPRVEEWQGLAGAHDRLGETGVDIRHREPRPRLDDDRRPVDERGERHDVEPSQPRCGTGARQVGHEGDGEHSQGDEVAGVQCLDESVVADVGLRAGAQAEVAERHRGERHCDEEDDDQPVHGV